MVPRRRVSRFWATHCGLGAWAHGRGAGRGLAGSRETQRRGALPHSRPRPDAPRPGRDRMPKTAEHGAGGPPDVITSENNYMDTWKSSQTCKLYYLVINCTIYFVTDKMYMYVFLKKVLLLLNRNILFIYRFCWAEHLRIIMDVTMNTVTGSRLPSRKIASEPQWEKIVRRNFIDYIDRS